MALAQLRLAGVRLVGATLGMRLAGTRLTGTRLGVIGDADFQIDSLAGHAFSV